MKADCPCRPAIWGFLLAVSLGVNALLAYLYVWNQEAPPPSPRYFRPEPVDVAGATVAPAEPTGMPDLRPRNDLAGLIDSWRQAGAEERVVRSLAIALVQDRFAGQMADLAYPADRPFWRQGAMNRSQTAPIEREKARLLARVLGEEIDLLTAGERAIQRRIYGDLPQAKIDRLMETSSRHRDLVARIAPDDPQRSEKLSTLQGELDRELASFLSPAELQKHLRQSSLNQPSEHSAK